MSEAYVGEIRVFAGNYAPQGWALCDGSLLSIASNTALFTLIGTTYGGDGQSTFALPDMRGRALIHQGAAALGTSYLPGQMAGAETVTLTPGQLPAHTHGLMAQAATASAPDPGPALSLAAAGGTGLIYGGGASAVSLAPAAVGPAGGNQPHDNRQPYVAISYIIATNGIFPSRN